MSNLLKILHLEDNSEDAELLQRELKGQGVHCSIKRVVGRADFLEALGNGVDLILADFQLPSFDGLSAFEVSRGRFPEIPFIFVSGVMGEDVAVEALKSGATDYVLKDRLARLGPAVRRAMREIESKAECRRLEARFIESQKMEVVGQLASGLAHDFNNIIAVIMGYSDLLLEELGPEERLRNEVGEIRHASERAAGLTRQLLVFSRKQTVKPVVLDLNKVVKDLDKMLRRLIGENIELTSIPGQQIGRVQADAGHVGQVLLNLAINARDAMPNGGRLTIATSNVTRARNGAPAPSGAMPGDYVMLRVADTGTGMSAKVKARLFEAFFTTKPNGKGTGLGLATCQTIVQQSGGYIDVQSEPGNGATFTVYFPRVEQPLDPVSGSGQPARLPRGTETLLVVEDQPAVRRLARDVLQAQGYAVLTASNGQEALQMAREHKGPSINLVVTDVVMPVMGGEAMAEWLQSMNPGLKILFTSGYTDVALAGGGDLDAGMEFLPKPYSPATLARKVREMLDNGGASSFAGANSIVSGGGAPVSAAKI